VFLGQAQEIRQARDLLHQELMRLPGLTVYPSRANFILFRTPVQQARAIHAGLMARGVLIKCLHGVHPQLADCLRVTVGTAEENERFITALTDILSQDKRLTKGLDIS
jgi:histidinol-phosphate aminotransferase